MEYLNPCDLASAGTPAPALSRGFAILRTLEVESPLSLEILAARLKLPKTSLFRLLETMQGIGCVRKTAEKKYEPLWVLRPIIDSQTSFVERLVACMKNLCKQTNCSVEWYEHSSDGMRMMRQELPDTEVCVKARPGFVCGWGPEFNATTQIAYAFAEDAPSPKGKFVAFRTNGVMEKISLSSVRRKIHAARETATARDPAFNTNGVRRWAAAVHSGRQFLGILAVAESFRFPHPRDAVNYQDLMLRSLKRLQPS